MQAKDRLLKEVETLEPYNIMKVYDIVLSLKKQGGGNHSKEKK